MPLTHYPHGVSSFGIPIVGPGAGGPLSVPGPNGNVWFVNGAIGSGVGDGSVENPYATITEALAVAQAGDTIYIFPSTYAENVVVATDYITLAGAQYAGYARPDIVPTTGIALTVTGQGFLARHLRFSMTTATTDVAVQEGNGFLYEDCVFDGVAAMTATKCLLRCVPSSTDDSLTASEGIISNCLFRGSTAHGILWDTAPAPVGVGVSDDLITGCIFTQNTNDDIATADTGTGLYSVHFTVVQGCIFEDKNKATYIDLTTANGGAASDQSGSIMACFFAMDTSTTTRIKMVGTAFTVVGCFNNTSTIIDGSALD